MMITKKPASFCNELHSLRINEMSAKNEIRLIPQSPTDPCIDESMSKLIQIFHYIPIIRLHLPLKH